MTQRLCSRLHSYASSA